MHYTLYGRVSTQVCRDCRSYPIFGFLRLYVDAKEIREPQIVDERGLAALGGKQVAREQVGEDGSYKINIDDRQSHYQGGPLLAVIEVPYLPPMKGEEKKHPTQYLVLGIIKPEWNQGDKDIRFEWSPSINEGLWCKLMALFDVWCICGRVVNCKSQKPAIGVTVKAFDDDWIKDDFLGQAVTDADGYFKICFRSITFKNTFLSPIINVETPFGSDMGPDVYFHIEAGPLKLLEEKPSDGQQEGRKNRSHCSCFNLCVDFDGPEEDGSPIRAVWMSVGGLSIPDGVSLNDFDAEGYGGAEKYGFFRTLPLKGELKDKSLAGNPMEFRFMVSQSTLNNAVGGSTVPAASFVPLTYANGFVGLTIGYMFKVLPAPLYLTWAPVTITPADVDPVAGWVNVKNAIDRTLAPLVPGAWYFEGNFYMAGLDSTKFTANRTPSALPGYVKPGVGPNPADEWGIEKIAIRFENREVVAPGVYSPTIGNGQTLNSIVVNNDDPYAIVEAQDEFGNVNYCMEFNVPPVLVYTVYHPHLRTASMHLSQNGGGYSAAQNNSPMPLSNGSSRPGITTVAGTRVIAPLMTQTCIYIANLSYDLRLTTGEGGQSWGPATSIFYYKHV